MAITTTKLNIPSEFTYTPISEREDKKPFTVTFKRLSLETTSSILDSAILVDANGKYTMQVNEQQVQVLRLALKDWNNMLDENNKQVKMKIEHGVISDDSLLMIPDYMRTEIASVILAVSKDPKDWEDILTSGLEQEDEPAKTN